MRSGTSREGVIDSKLWEVKAQQMLRITTNTRKVEKICSLIPFKEESDLLDLIKARSDLDILFALCCEFPKLTSEQSIHPLPIDKV
jgi:hypothetical protein